MTNGYLTFLDYLELRRRVEKRLAAGNWFLLHIIIFIIGATMIGLAGFHTTYDPDEYFFIFPYYGHWVTFWSGVLLTHGLWSYWRSGARGGKRDHVIESEMRERIKNNDLFLSDHPRDLFQLHGLLNDDIQKRASMTPILLFFVFINASIWIPWTLAGEARTSFAWMLAALLVVPMLLALIWNLWQRRRHRTQLRKQLEQYFSNERNDDERNDERETRLSNDNDELVTVDEYMMKRKRSS
jgi:hypothetical protein